MPFDLNTFIGARPWVYHLTSKDNFPTIRQQRRLESASELIGKANLPELLRRRRPTHISIRVAEADIQLRDQAPLHAANIAFEDGWQLPDFIEQLNKLVFFWPGSATGPSRYGRRHFDRYESENPVLLRNSRTTDSLPAAKSAEFLILVVPPKAACALLRVSTRDLITDNSGVEPMFCRFNSGSPRYSNGRASPRGPGTFVSSDRFAGRPSEVVELTFPGSVKLPKRTEYGSTPDGPWIELESVS